MELVALAAVRRLVPPCLAAAAALAFTAAGCGDARKSPPDPTTIGRPFGLIQTDFPKSGMSIQVPKEWRKADGTAPLVVTMQAGSATVAVWRYPRTEPLPADHAALVAAKSALVAAVVQRDPTFSLTRAKLLHVGDAKAIEVIGTGSIAGLRRRLRSTHVYAAGAEFVVDAYAPPDQFARVDREVFAPVTTSLKIAKAPA